MAMAGRSWSASDYRYGYQGSEVNRETYGNSNQYTTEFRQLDPRFGRWFSTDPVFQPHQSPYNSMNGDPVNLTDVLGDDPNADDVADETVKEYYDIYGYGYFEYTTDKGDRVRNVFNTKRNYIGTQLLNEDGTWSDHMYVGYPIEIDAINIIENSPATELKEEKERQRFRRQWETAEIGEIGKDWGNIAGFSISVVITAPFAAEFLIAPAVENVAAMGTAKITEEVVEAVIEEVTGVPIVNDFFDLWEQGLKKSAKKIMKPGEGPLKPENWSGSAKRSGRAGKQKRLKDWMNDPKANKADKGWLKNDVRHTKRKNKPKKGLRIPRNGRKSPGRKAKDKGYELAHPNGKGKSASHGNSLKDSRVKNAADHKVETKYHRGRY